MSQGDPPSKPRRRLALVGCGVLQREADALIAGRGWPLVTRYLPSSLHNSLSRLSRSLDAALEFSERHGERPVVLYGACHPCIDTRLSARGVVRTHGQNCIAQLIGHDRFMEEASAGAYFLLEEWARTFETQIYMTFGRDLGVIREIFHACHRSILAVRTPCSGDFTAEAEAAARLVDLPLRWTDVDLAHLESVLVDVLDRDAEAQNGETA